jgi:hypothetical protein
VIIKIRELRERKEEKRRTGKPQRIDPNSSDPICDLLYKIPVQLDHQTP